MIGVLTHHWAKEGRLEEAHELLDRNGLAQSKAPGFDSRRTLYSLSDANKITTLVTWGQRRDIRRLEGEPGARCGHGGGRRALE